MGLRNKLKQIFGNRRTEDRIRSMNDVHCRIEVAGEGREVTLCNVSNSGIGFLVKDPAFELSSQVQIQIIKKGWDLRLFRKGRIVSQDIVYFTENESLDRAYYRFSVKFDESLSGTDFASWI